jgi:Zn-dependent peptidase ImmA (M78 family)
MTKEENKYWTTDEFINLFDEWNEILDRYPDTNIEIFPTETGPICSPQLKKYSTVINPETYEDNFEYYKVASQLLYYEKWQKIPIKNKKYSIKNMKKIWALHTKGYTFYQIAELLPDYSLWNIRIVIHYIKNNTLKQYLLELHTTTLEENI